MKKARLEKALFTVIVLFCPMSVTIWNKFFLVFVLFCSICLLALLSLSEKGISINRLQGWVLFFYLSIFAVGFTSVLFTSSQSFGMLLDTATLGRLFTVSVSSITLLAGAAYISSLDRGEISSLSYVFLYPGAVFVFFGFYQLFCNITGIPFLIETRDWMHGMPNVVRDVFPKRITSIAEEPSFLAPVLIEFFILSLFLVTKKWVRNLTVSASLLLIVMTFSGGAYVNMLLIVSFALFLMLWKYPIGKLHIAVGVAAAAFLVFLFNYGQILIEFATSKFAYEASGGSARSQFMVSLIHSIFNSDALSLVFGHGVTSLSYLNEFGMRTEDALFRISNNMFLDVTWESGIIGTVAAILMFGVMFKQGLLIQRLKTSSLSLSLMLVAQVIITSLYRSEYISTHMIWVVLAVFWAVRYDTCRNNLEVK